MKIILVSCVAPPETIVAGHVFWDIAIDQHNRGNEVLIITPKPSRPLGKFKFVNNFDKITDFGFRHICINSFVYPKNNILGRSMESFSFGFNAAFFIKKRKIQADLIYALTWPFLGQSIFLKILGNRYKVINNIQDLYPESFIRKYNSKFLTFLLKPLNLLDNWVVKNSLHSTVVSNSMKKYYIEKRKINEKKITVIENWQDETLFVNNNNFNKSEILRKYSLEHLNEKFIYLYLGNIGPVAGIDKIILDFKNKSLPAPIRIIIAGSGSSKQYCINLVHKFGLNHIFEFVDIGIDKLSVVELQYIANIFLLPINKGLSSSSIPSKLIAYMFSGKPILTSAEKNSFTAEAIINADSGWIIDENKTWHDYILSCFILNSTQLYKKGENARNFGLKNYSKSIGLHKINNLFKEKLEI